MCNMNNHHQTNTRKMMLASTERCSFAYYPQDCRGCGDGSCVGCFSPLLTLSHSQDAFSIHLLGGGTRRSSDRCCLCEIEACVDVFTSLGRSSLQPCSLSAWLISLQYSWRKALSIVLGVFGRHSCLCQEIPPLSDGPRLIPFEANCSMRCSHCEVDPCFQFVFWLDVWHFMVAVCIVDAFFVLSQNLAVWFVSGSLVSPSSASPAVGHSLVFLSVLSSSSWVGVSPSALQSSSASPNRRREIVSPSRRRACVCLSVGILVTSRLVCGF